MQCHIAIYVRSTGTSVELEPDLRQKVEARGDIVVAAFTDQDAEDRRKHRMSGWKALLASLDGVDQIALASAGDIPGKTVRDLLLILGRLRDHGVGLLLLAENLDTSNGSALTVLEIIDAFRRAKLSHAIRFGQAKARAAGKSIGRPEVPANVRRRIAAALEAGGGIRPTAKKSGVAPGTGHQYQAVDGTWFRPTGGLTVPIAVIARLGDKVTEAQIEKLADGLPDPKSVRPPLHLHFATYGNDTDIGALDEALARAIDQWTQVSVSLVGFGIFPGAPSDVWLVPVPIHGLLQLHLEVDAALFEAAGRHSHEFGIWVPTVSIGQTTHDSDSVEVLVRLYEGPIDVTLDRIELVRTDPFEIISSRPLRP